ncbi:MAG TPA: response regulator, partial [Burkholderiales bacterium]
MALPRPADLPEPKPVRILLIEDEQSCADIVTAYLGRIEWACPEVEAVGTLREALARLTLEHFDIVIIDLNLPDSTGIATLQAVARTCDRLIIVLTARHDPGLREEALEHGAYELMQKESLSEAALERLLRLATVQAGAARSLRDSETRFRKTFELAASGMAHVGLDGSFLRVNRRLCDILGYT